jgi:hypothetical protein
LLLGAQTALEVQNKSRNGSVSDESMVDLAIGYACLGDWQRSTQLAKAVRGVPAFGDASRLNWSTNAMNDRSAVMSMQSQELKRALQLSPLASIA